MPRREHASGQHRGRNVGVGGGFRGGAHTGRGGSHAGGSGGRRWGCFWIIFFIGLVLVALAVFGGHRG